MKRLRNPLLIFTLVAAFVLAGTGLALAATGTVIPHGGYSTSTDACLQCHDVHQAAGEYALTRWSTVTDTCGSCHTLYLGTLEPYYGATPTNSSFDSTTGGRSPAMNLGEYDLDNPPPAGNPANPNIGLAYDPGYGGAVATPGSAAPYVAYKTDWTSRYSHEGHRLGQLYNPSSPLQFADGMPGDANYIPGGTESLTRMVSSMFYTTEPATSISSLAGVNVDPWVTGLSGTAGLYCASCHTPHGTFGYMLPLVNGAGNLVGQDNILSSRPNHRLPTLTSTGVVELWNPADPIATIGDRNDVSSWMDEGGNWCARCHDKRLYYSQDLAGNSHYNHPDTYCLVCHADTGFLGEGYDFPHTSTIPNLLLEKPDELCIQCHAAGTLP